MTRRCISHSADDPPSPVSPQRVSSGDTRLKRRNAGRNSGGVVPDDGITFAEMLLATSIALIAGLAIFFAVNYLERSASDAMNRPAAVALASARIEHARSLPYDSVGTFDQVTGRYGDPAGPITTCEATAGLVIDTRVTWAREDAFPYRATHKGISVVVSWTAPMPGEVVASSAIYGCGAPLYTGDVRITVVSCDPCYSPVSGATVMLMTRSAPPRSLRTGPDGVASFGHVPRESVPIRVPSRVTVDGQMINLPESAATILPNGGVKYVVDVQSRTTP